jgi:hypothetical protein
MEKRTVLWSDTFREYKDITLVDTHPNLDGDTDKFLDMMHFTRSGDRQMAETMFAGITNVLSKDLFRKE